MKNIKFVVLISALTVFVGLLFYFLGDFSNRAKLIYNVLREEDKEKIINNLVEKVDTDSMKTKLELSLKTFSQKIENDEYSDEYLESLLKDFDNLSNKEKIDSALVEEFYQKVNRDF